MFLPQSSKSWIQYKSSWLKNHAVRGVEDGKVAWILMPVRLFRAFARDAPMHRPSIEDSLTLVQ